MSSLRAACLVIASALGLSACAAPQSYMGIDFVASSSAADTQYIPPEIRDLAKRAQAGDKQAQLDLGIAFEEGEGVLQDFKKAKSLYEMAATSVGGWQQNGRVYTGYKVEGLPQAAARQVQMVRQQSVPSEQIGENINADSTEHIVRLFETPLAKGETGKIFSILVKLELYNDICIMPELNTSVWIKTSSNRAAWQCIVDTPLPDDCRSYAPAIKKAARAVRMNSRFSYLENYIPNIIRMCSSENKIEEYNEKNSTDASLLDFLLFGTDMATENENARVAKAYENLSQFAHSNYIRPNPNIRFADSMCRIVKYGNDIPQIGFWIMYCVDVEIVRGELVSKEIDTLLGRGN